MTKPRTILLQSHLSSGMFMATEEKSVPPKGWAVACFVPEAWTVRYGVFQAEFSQYGLRRHMDLNPARPTKLKPKAS